MLYRDTNMMQALQNGTTFFLSGLKCQRSVDTFKTWQVMHWCNYEGRNLQPNKQSATLFFGHKPRQKQTMQFNQISISTSSAARGGAGSFKKVIYI